MLLLRLLIISFGSGTHFVTLSQMEQIIDKRLLQEIERVRHRRINIEEPTGTSCTDCIIIVRFMKESYHA